MQNMGGRSGQRLLWFALVSMMIPMSDSNESAGYHCIGFQQTHSSGINTVRGGRDFILQISRIYEILLICIMVMVMTQA